MSLGIRLFSASLFLTAFFMIATVASAQDSVKSLVVGMFRSPSMTVSHIAEDGTRSGFFYELAQEISVETGIAITFQDYDDIQDMRAGFIAGEIQFITLAAKSSALLETSVFSDPVTESNYAFVRRRDQPISIVADPAPGTKLAVPQFVREQTALALSDSFEIVPANDPVAALSKVIFNEVDAAILPEDVAYFRSQNSKIAHFLAFSPASVPAQARYIAIHKSRADLLAQINGALNTLRQDGRLDRLLSRSKIEIPPGPPTVLSVGVYHFPPYQIANDDGSFSGFGVDTFRDIAELANLNFKFVEIEDIDAWKAGPSADTYDILPQVGVSQDRRDFMDFSLSVEIAPFSIFVRTEDAKEISEIGDLAGLNVGMQPANLAFEYAQGQGNMTLVPAEDVNDLLDQLLNGQTDAIIFPTQTVNAAIEDRNLVGKIEAIYPPAFKSERAIALRFGLDETMQQLNAVIPDYLISDRYQSLTQTYFGEPVFWTPLRQNIVFTVLGFFGICFVALLGAYYASQRARARLSAARQAAEISSKESKQQAKAAQALAEKLQISDQRLKLATGQVAIWDWDVPSDELYMSPSFYEGLGYSLEEFDAAKNGAISNLIHESDRQKYIEGMQKSLANPSDVYASEHRFKAKSGSYHWYLAIGKASVSAKGKPVRFSGVLSQIDDLVLARSEAQQANETLADAVENSNQTFTLWDDKDCLIFGNRLFREAHSNLGEKSQPGVRFIDFLKAGIAAGNYPDALGNESAFIRQQIDARENPTLDGLLERMQDDRFLMVRSQRLSHSGYLVVHGQDITELHAQELKTRASEARLQRAQKIGHIGSWEVDADGNFTCSDEVNATFGVSPADFAGSFQTMQKMIHPADRKRVQKAIAQAWKSQKTCQCDYRIIRPDGEVRIVRQNAELIQDEEMAATFLEGTLQDITKQVETEEKLRKSQNLEAIGQLTGGVAHDFNNLLAVILGNMELLREELDDPEYLRWIDACISATLRGSDLTHNMLAFARKARLAPEVIDLNTLASETRIWAGRTLPANIEIETSLAAGLWSIEADPSSTESALLNLLLNARDAMPSGGKLTIKTTNFRVDESFVQNEHSDLEPGPYVVLSISDTGKGISPEHLEHIFEPFFSTKPLSSGSGLGLSMIDGFMRQSNGAVYAESAIGVGTTLKLFFKASNGAIDLSGAGQPAPATKPSGQNILVAEDEAEVLDVLVSMLKRAGFNVTPAASGDAALQVFDANPGFDLLLTDIVMPGSLQGTDLCKALRERQPELPVVFMSGYANQAPESSLDKGGKDIHLMKPVARNKLLEAINKALEK